MSQPKAEPCYYGRIANKKQKSTKWFTPVRGSYLPANWEGWLTYLPFIGYLVFSLVVSLDYTGSNLKAVLLIVPNWVAATVVMTWIARATS